MKPFFHANSPLWYFRAQNGKTKKTGLNPAKNDFERMVFTMKKDELIKLGLDEETAKKVEAASTEELKGYIPKARFDGVNNEKNTLQTTLKERDGQLETLKNSTGDIEGLKKQISDLQADNSEKDKSHAAEIKTLKINAAVDAALTAAKAKNQKAVRALLDLEKADLADDGTVKGLDEQIKKLAGAEDSKFLFDTEKKKPQIKGASPAETGKEDLDTKVDFTKMTYEEIAAYMEENPGAEI
jgi:hypothetical protein